MSCLNASQSGVHFTFWSQLHVSTQPLFCADGSSHAHLQSCPRRGKLSALCNQEKTNQWRLKMRLQTRKESAGMWRWCGRARASGCYGEVKSGQSMHVLRHREVVHPHVLDCGVLGQKSLQMFELCAVFIIWMRLEIGAALPTMRYKENVARVHSFIVNDAVARSHTHV